MFKNSYKTGSQATAAFAAVAMSAACLFVAVSPARAADRQPTTVVAQPAR